MIGKENSVPEVYGEDVHIYNHCTNCKERLQIKVLCGLFNDMADIHTRLEGVDVSVLKLRGFTWMLRRIHILISDMPQKEETVRINTWCSGVRGVFLGRDYYVLSDVPPLSINEGRIRVKAHSEWMVIDIAKRRPGRPTPEMLAEAARCTQTAWEYPSLFNKSEEKDLSSLPPLAWEPARVFQANFDDIDFNGHVTQSSYIQWMMNGLSFDFMKHHTLCELEVIYDKEIPPEEQVTILCAVEEEDKENQSLRIIHTVQSAGQKLHCKARSVWKKK